MTIALANNREEMKGNPMEDQKGRNMGITRRDFIKVSGAIVIVAGIGGCSATDESPTPTDTPLPTDAPLPPTGTPVATQILTPEAQIPPADGYLLVDIEKCQGCLSCMLACSLIHEGVESPSLSRIQIMQNSFVSFPHDLTIEQCRQCVEPACVEICPVDALEPDADFGNVRIVDREKCIGCGLCFEACPFTPSRAFLSPDAAYDDEAKSRKCDLCANAPYHWDEAGGGPDGKQACVAVCPVGAIAFTAEIPTQEGDSGYKVNLRDEVWGTLGYSTS
jgi:protein NrfC